MIIWINGAFGSGKTQTAYELHRRIPHSYVYDPENVGFFIRENIPSEIGKEDFQAHSVWRESNYMMLKYIASKYNGVIIVPMTVVNPQYFEEMVGKLKLDGIVVHHFVLWADKETVEKRLKSRGEGKNSWAAKQIDRCLSGLSNDIFQPHLDTENKSIEEVAEVIAVMSGIKLLPDSRSKVRKGFDRLKTKIKHVRFLN